MWPAVVSLFSAVGGWFLAKLLAEPLLSIYELRLNTQEVLILYGNLKADAPATERDAAAGRFRTVGAAMVTAHLAAWPWVRWFYRRLLRWDPYSAGELCMGFGRLIEGRYSQLNLSPEMPDLRQLLRLPTPRATDRRRLLFHRAGWSDPDTVA